MGIRWEINPNSADLAPIATGDRIILHAGDAWEYNVEASVVSVNGDRIEAVIADIFTREDNGGQIIGGEILGFVGKTLSFGTANVFDVLKR